MEIIAQKNNETFLVLAKNSKEPGERIGFIADSKARVRYQEQSIESMIKFGYWKDYKGSQGLLKEIDKYKKV